MLDWSIGAGETNGSKAQASSHYFSTSSNENHLQPISRSIPVEIWGVKLSISPDSEKIPKKYTRRQALPPPKNHPISSGTLLASIQVKHSGVNHGSKNFL